MIVEIISVGTEILLGNIVNTNANYLAKKCADLGLNHYYQVSVGDNEERLEAAIKLALTRSDILILTGGLGPTKDDLTKEVTARVCGKALILDNATKEYIRELFALRHVTTISENNWKQAQIIEGSRVIKNDNGTAPGLIVPVERNKHIILLPGPPNELIPMFEKDVLPFLKGLEPNILHSVMVKICGIGESMAETMIQDLIDNQSNPTIAPYAKTGEVHFRITARAQRKEDCEAIIEPVIKELKQRFGNHIYSLKDEDNLEDVVVNLLIQNNLTVSTAESCTGGLISSRLINVSGASKVFNEGFITYSNEAKAKYLSVPEEILKTYGAVSKETAYEMAKGVMKTTSSDTSIVITGIAGPTGGTKEKPVGLIYVGIGFKEDISVFECNFYGNRNKIRDNSVIFALNKLRLKLIDYFGEMQ